MCNTTTHTGSFSHTYRDIDNCPVTGQQPGIQTIHVFLCQLLVRMPNWSTYTRKNGTGSLIARSTIPVFHRSTIPLFHSIVPLFHSTIPRSIESRLPVWEGLAMGCVGFIYKIVEITAASSNNGCGRVLGLLCMGRNRAGSNLAVHFDFFFIFFSLSNFSKC